MNRVYKVIWSKVKGCYVVVSELAKRDGKVQGSRRTKAGRGATAVLAALVLTMGFGVSSALAADSDPVTDITMTTKDAFTKKTYQNSFDAAGLVPGKSESKHSTAIGHQAFGDPNIGTNSGSSVAIGDAAQVGNDAVKSIVLGYNGSVADGAKQSTVVGANSTAEKAYDVVVGEKAKTSSMNSVAMGQRATIESGAENSVAIGGLYTYDEESGLGGGGSYMVKKGAKNSTVIGAGTLSQSEGATALGTGARVMQGAANSVALGTGSIVSGADILASDKNGVVSVGTGDKTRRIINVSDGVKDKDAVNVSQLKKVADTVEANNELAVKYDSAAKDTVTLEGEKGTALKNVSDITMTTKDAFNNKTYQNSFDKAGLVPGKSESKYSTAIGHQAFGDPNIGTNSGSSVAIGDAAQVGNDAVKSIVLGYNGSVADGAKQSTVVGANSTAEKAYDVVIGEKAKTSSMNSVAMGQQATIESGAENSVAIGGLYTYDEESGLGGGGSYMVAKGAKNSTVIGAGTLSQSEGATALGTGARVTQGAKNSVALGTGSIVSGVDILASDKNGVVSVGTGDKTRRIINVSDAVKDSDAMTLGQFKKAITPVPGASDPTKGKNVQYEQDGSLDAGTDGTGRVQLDKQGGAALTNAAQNASVKADANGTAMSYAGKDATGNDIASNIAANATGAAMTYKGKDAQGNDVQNGVVVDKNGTTINGNLNVNGDLAINGNTIATSKDISNISKQMGTMSFDNGGKDLTDAVNKNTKASADNTTAIAAANKIIGSGSLTNGAADLTAGVNTNYEAIQSNAAGIQSNSERITNNTAAIERNSQSIQALGRDVNNLGDEVDSVGALSAALAGLHPLDYDGLSKFQVSAALGTYDGTQAAAVGGFYHANKDVLFSLGASRSFNGDHKTAGNFGVTFRVGPSSQRPAMKPSADTQQEVEALKAQVEVLKQEIENLKKNK